MVEQVTQQAMRVMRRASEDAGRFKIHSLFGSDAFLLGILRESTCLAARVLTSLGVDAKKTRGDLEARIRAAGPQEDFAQAAMCDNPMLEGNLEASERRHRCANTAHYLLGILKHEDTAAVRVLVEQGLNLEQARSAAIDAAAKTPQDEGGAVAFFEQPSAAGWIEELQDANAQVRRRAVTTLPTSLALGQVNLDPTQAAPALSKLLRDPDWKARHAAADSLGLLGPSARGAVPALREALRDRPEVRAAAAEALAQIGGDAALADHALAQAIHDPSFKVQVAAAEALWSATAEPKIVLPSLIESLRSGDPQTQTNAANVLARLGAAAAEAVPALVEVLNQDMTREPADQAFSHLAIQRQWVVAPVLLALGEIGAPARVAVPTLIKLLGRNDPLAGITNQHVVAGLVKIVATAPDAVTDLAEALKHSERDVRLMSAFVLGQVGDAARPALTALREALGDPSGLVRVQAARVLAGRGEREAIMPILVAALGDTEDGVALTAASALASIGPEASAATEPLQRLLVGDDHTLRSVAAAALISITGNTELALPVFRAVIANSEEQLLEVMRRHRGGGVEDAARKPSLSYFSGGDMSTVPMPIAMQAMATVASETQRLQESGQLPQPQGLSALPVPQPAQMPSHDLGKMLARLQKVGSSRGIFGTEPKRSPHEEIADWTDAIARDPEDAQAYRLRAEAHLENGDYPQVIADCSAALQIEPDDAAAWFLRGKALHKAGEHERGIADFTEAIARRPDHLDAHLWRGNACLRLRDYDGALGSYEEGLRQKPDSTYFLLNRALAHKGKKNYAQALADLNAALTVDPQYPNANNNLAWLLATCADGSIRDGARALQYARKACDLTAWNNPLMLGTLGAAYAELGQFDEAIRWTKQALAHENLAADRAAEIAANLKCVEECKPIRD